MSTFTAAVDLPVTDHTVRDARVVALDAARAWDSAVSQVDLALLVDDLTADVVAHAGGESSLLLELTLSDESLRVGLADGSAVRPVAAKLDRSDPLGVLRVLASRWGHETYHGGHRIWFELTPATASDTEQADGLTPEMAARIRASLADDPTGGASAPARRTTGVRDAARRLLTRPLFRRRGPVRHGPGTG
jgi:hypothetical protein